MIKMENMNRVLFYCMKCDEAPVEHYVGKDNFYRCKECKERLNAVKKDKYEK